MHNTRVGDVWSPGMARTATLEEAKCFFLGGLWWGDSGTVDSCDLLEIWHCFMCDVDIKFA